MQAVQMPSCLDKKRGNLNCLGAWTESNIFHCKDNLWFIVSFPRAERDARSDSMAIDPGQLLQIEGS